MQGGVRTPQGDSPSKRRESSDKRRLGRLAMHSAIRDARSLGEIIGPTSPHGNANAGKANQEHRPGRRLRNAGRRWSGPERKMRNVRLVAPIAPITDQDTQGGDAYRGWQLVYFKVRTGLYRQITDQSAVENCEAG